MVTITIFSDTVATAITGTSTGVIIGGSLSGVIILIVIIIGTVICVAAIHSKKKSRRLNVMPPSTSMTMTTMPRSISDTDYYDQPQSKTVQYEIPSPAYQKQHRALPPPPRQGFSKHSYTQDIRGNPVGQGHPLNYEETSLGYQPGHTYEYMAPGPH